jgi:hypothetical protein
MPQSSASPTDLFGRKIENVFSSVQSVPHTADRGFGAPALNTAREAVRQDAVKHGNSDPSSLWSERRMQLSPRSRTEHLAIGSGAQNEMFAFTPGSRAVDPKSAEALPYSDYFDMWWKRRDVDASERDYFAHAFARSHKVIATRSKPGTTAVSVAVAGLVFESNGTDLYDALDSLAYTVRGGPAMSARPAAPEPSALDLIAQARARMPEAERARRDAYSHFMGRRIALSRSRDRGFLLTVSANDKRHAATLGITPPEGDRASEITEIAKFFGECADMTRDLEDAAWFGLTKDLLPGEAMERATAQVQRVERYQNDRYIDHSARAHGNSDGRVGDSGDRTDSLLERSAVLESGADPLGESEEVSDEGRTA